MTGCSDLLTEGTADLAGVGGAAAAHAVTNNPTVTTAIGLGVGSLAMSGLKSEERAVHNRRSRTGSPKRPACLPVGTVGTWSVTHSVPIEDDQKGELVVSREIGATPTCIAGKSSSPSIPSQNGQPARAFYTATVCLDGTRWKWASAEPATARWGSLQ